MLVPRESDIPALFLVFVLLPLVSYFILGKWSETSKRKERLSLIASEAAEEPLRVNDMAVGSVMPLMHMPNTNSGIRQCARCFASATTRCSQCKAVWYCSGRCQIVHWRHVHKLECQQLGSSPKHLSIEGSLGGVSHAETMDQCTFKYDNALSEDVVSQRSAGIDTFLSSHRDSSEEEAGTGFTQPPEDAYMREGDLSLSEHRANSPCVSKNEDNDLRGALHENDVAERECVSAFDGGNSREILNLSTTAMSGTNETKGLNCSSERTSTMSSKSRIASQSNGIDLHNSPKSRMKTSKEPLSSDTEIISVQIAKESRIATLKDDPRLQENNNLGLMKVTKSTKVDNHQQSEDSTIRKRKVKMIFPYEEFVKYFQYEAFNVAPRGLVNCGNSCYANAVLQCLACTKPLIIYLLRQSHSKAGCSKDWCLVCELEQLVLILRQSGGPLSPINILVYIRGLNSQIGDGSQEDAHEFLRLLVASMQAIFLEGYGGENADPKLQDTTFIQHTFGGCLRSKVKCLRCHHESERDEKMMDLTLEIFGRVKSLEDALTQFTSSEYLDGDNMYRCARCAEYVRARKQLNIKEAPNILTIVLKRFQEGNYGKINKCITFPEMLDMTPYMTGTDDIPPIYMLYAVVVHLDISDASSYSGHYIAYVKDLLGNWFMVDDTEVHPVEVNHVMSQEAYILFYMRSYPRPARKATRCQMKAQRSPRPEHSVPSQIIIERSEPRSGPNSETNLVRQSRSRPSALKKFPEFSDATSSDWSLFTSSDDSSFTTESARDSFSTVDHTEVPSSSISQPAESSSKRSLSSRVLPDSKPQTRFAREGGDHSGVNHGSHEARQGPTQTHVNCTI